MVRKHLRRWWRLLLWKDSGSRTSINPTSVASLPSSVHFDPLHNERGALTPCLCGPPRWSCCAPFLLSVQAVRCFILPGKGGVLDAGGCKVPLQSCCSLHSVRAVPVPGTRVRCSAQRSWTSHNPAEELLIWLSLVSHQLLLVLFVQAPLIQAAAVAPHGSEPPAVCLLSAYRLPACRLSALWAPSTRCSRLESVSACTLNLIGLPRLPGLRLNEILSRRKCCDLKRLLQPFGTTAGIGII